LKSVRLAVRLQAEESFRVQNNVVKGAFRPELTLSGTGELPVLQGEVYVDPTRVTMPAGRLNVESGILRFQPGQPDRPLLNLQASSRMRGYDVSLLVEGTVDEPVVTVSSVPPLPSDELVLLLLTGRAPQNGGAKGVYMAQAGVQLAVFLGKGFLAKWYGKDAVEVEESILDRFELNIGQGITEKGDNTIEAQFRVADDLLWDEDALYLMTEKDVYDDFNAGLRMVFRFK
jgi:translocation and assembly module TamB